MAPSRAEERAAEGDPMLRNDADSFEYDDERAQLNPKRRRSLTDTFSDGWQSMTATLRNRHSHAAVDSKGSSARTGGRGKVQMHQQWPSTLAAKFAAIVRRACLVLPILILMLFGVLHILHALIGRAHLFWDSDHEDFLPHWGQPGYVGDGLAKYPTDATRDIIPIPCHSHNDYWRRIPLFEAIHYGCTGVEADVWLFDEELYVGHNVASLTRNRTFRGLYVDPIVALLDKQNPRTDFTNATGHGVFDTDGSVSLTLLVDFKTDGYKTWPYVSSQLSALRDKGYLTYFDGDKTVRGAVTVVGTGNTPFDLVVANETYRDIFFDAPLDKLWELPQEPGTPQTLKDTEVDSEVGAGTVMPFEGTSVEEGWPMEKRGQGNEGLGDASPEDFNPSTSYYASVSFNAAVGQIWQGHISPRQMEIIRGQIRGAKRRGLKARYWDTPSWPISLRNHVWHVLMKEGADILNVDDLRSAARLDWRKWRHEWW